MNLPFGVDENGFIVTEVSIDKIGRTFGPIVDETVDEVLRSFAGNLCSIYLYGSIATGRAVLGSSDLDLLLIFKQPPDAIVRTEVQALSRRLSKKFASSLRGVGIEVSDASEVSSRKEEFGLLCFLKHLCVCLHGSDLARDAPRYRPSATVARGFNGDIRRELRSWRARITSSAESKELLETARSASRKIVRTGFSLVMPRMASWTTELSLSCEAFGAVYSEKADDMKQALGFAQSGTTDREAILRILDEFGGWLADEFDRVIPPLV